MFHRKKRFYYLIKEPLPLILRGGDNSLERGLAEEAEDLGVEFKFKSRPKPKAGDILATGPKRTDMVAFGAYYENSDFPRDQFLYMHDEKYSPRGWYLYVIPMDDDTIKIMNCCSKPYAKQVRKLLYKAVEERDILKILLMVQNLRARLEVKAVSISLKLQLKMEFIILEKLLVFKILGEDLE